MAAADDEKKKWAPLVNALEPGSAFLRAQKLGGGVSAVVTLLEWRRPNGETARCVVRQHGAADLRRNPRLAADEFKLLRQLEDAGLPVPGALYADPDGELLGSPCVVTRYVEGATAVAEGQHQQAVDEMAAVLSQIHLAGCQAPDLSFLPVYEEIAWAKLNHPPSVPDEALSESRIRAALLEAWPLRGRNGGTLLHGDYWPGNLLWQDGRLAAVLDWEDAAVGDPLSDLAGSRLELLWAYGPDAMETFTRAYTARMSGIDYTDLPYWELYAALRPAGSLAHWGLLEDAERRMRERHRWFVEEAFRRLRVTS
ncbi:phosphotransferase family protein [Paenibacillus montanisoli]|uniref:Phosphotransferase family protein n=1 Tax=Paenibacillus montanisoli TaxID=2081970 RepID=A0A328U887_9BACL|nr:phosphotransferase [Paenibacillus montanisoli]RAP77175.1 phosphotransferase family protein [Paenibacillus montanisoli]